MENARSTTVPGRLKDGQERSMGRTFSLFVVYLTFLPLLSGCRTIPPLPPVNLSEAGWTTQRGQATWRAGRDAPEITGELLVATHPDGRTFVDFTKPPVPIVTAQTGGDGWQVYFALRKKTYSGRGTPPARLVWLHLSRYLAGLPPPKSWSWQRRPDNFWRLENRATGEFLEGYLNP